MKKKSNDLEEEAKVSQVNHTIAEMTDKVGKYLSFRLVNEEYGIQILKVESIIGMMLITTVPRVPVFIRGVINLRGKIIPIVDLSVKFGKEASKDTKKTCIIVVRIEVNSQQKNMGIIVDEVYEVVEINADQMEPAPEFGTAVNTDFLLGMAKVHEKVMMMLDIDQILSSADLSTLEIPESEVLNSEKSLEKDEFDKGGN